VRVLLAEDDVLLAAAVRTTLVAAAFIVDVETDGEIVHYRGENEEFDAILLDLGLPSVDGLTILKHWRNKGIATPVRSSSRRGRNGRNASKQSKQVPTTIWSSRSAWRSWWRACARSFAAPTGMR